MSQVKGTPINGPQAKRSGYMTPAEEEASHKALVEKGIRERQEQIARDAQSHTIIGNAYNPSPDIGSVADPFYAARADVAAKRRPLDLTVLVESAVPMTEDKSPTEEYAGVEVKSAFKLDHLPEGSH